MIDRLTHSRLRTTVNKPATWPFRQCSKALAARAIRCTVVESVLSIEDAPRLLATVSRGQT
jgi:hypothetical protein